MTHPTARALRDCLATDDVRAVLDRAVLGRAGRPTWSVLVPAGEGRWSPLLAGPVDAPGDPIPAFPSALDAALDALWSATDAEGPVELPPSEPGPGRASRRRLAAPLAFREERYGLLVLDGDESLDPEDWREVVDVLSAELVKAQLYETTSRESATSAHKLEALHEAGTLVKELDLEVLLTKLMDLAIRIMGADVGAIVLAGDGTWRTGVEWGLREEVVTALRTRDGRSFLDAALAGGATLLVDDPGTSEWIDPTGLTVDLRSIVALPLLTKTRRLGVLVLVNSQGGALKAEDSDVLATIANLSATAIENAQLVREALDHERVAAEMGLAAAIQQRFFPDRAPDVPGCELAGWSRPCSETGGDWFDYLDLGEGRTGIVVADATGHGMGAALITFIVRSSLKALLGRTREPGELVPALNDLLEADAEPGKFMTLFLGELDPARRVLRWCSAGHDPALVHRAGTDEFLELPSTGMPLGILAGSDFGVREFALRPGDTVVFGTDGIWEARDAAGTFFGKDRLREIIRAGSDRPLPELSGRVRAELDAFHDGAEPRDDITAVFLRVLD